jgi:hypothetical protein
MIMTTRNRLASLLAASVLVANTLTADAKKEPTALELRFFGIERIVVLPPVDARNGEKPQVGLDDIRTNVVNLLEKKNYVAEAGSFAEGAERPVEEDLKEARPEWIKALGPADARWIMVVVLHDVTSRMNFGSSGNAELSGYLYDREDGSLVWQGKGVGQAGQGGLIGILMKSTMKGEALGKAASNLINAIPKRPKAKR